jgi:copper chaperone CopZ
MIEHGYAISGMNCGNCAKSVTKHLTALPGVTEVDVEVATGRVVVRAWSALAADDVRAAVEEAGYRLDSVTSLAS